MVGPPKQGMPKVLEGVGLMLRALKVVSAATSVATLLTAGAAGASSIYNTGPGSYNSVYSSYSGGSGGYDWCHRHLGGNNRYDSRFTDNSRVTNNNNISVRNSNYQTARTGNATVWGNTYGGSARSGDASNYNETSIWVSVYN